MPLLVGALPMNQIERPGTSKAIVLHVPRQIEIDYSNDQFFQFASEMVQKLPAEIVLRLLSSLGVEIYD